MRALIPCATGVALLSGVGIAEKPATRYCSRRLVPLPGDAQRCGVPAERVLRAGRVIRDMIASVSTEPSKTEVAGARFARVFLSSATRRRTQSSAPLPARWWWRNWKG